MMPDSRRCVDRYPNKDLMWRTAADQIFDRWAALHPEFIEVWDLYDA